MQPESETRAALAIQLSPADSGRLVLWAEARAKAYGWDGQRLVDAYNKRAADGAAPLTLGALWRWTSRARLGQPLRLDLDKALILFAVFGAGSNRLDKLIAELGDEVAALIDEAVSDAAV